MTLDELPLAIRDIAAERQRQISAEGYDPAHDDAHTMGELAQAAGVYATPARDRDPQRWPWGDQYKPAAVSDFPAGRRRELIKAGALIVAEIERIDRAALRARQEGDASNAP